MRPVTRLALPQAAARYLAQRQQRVHAQQRRPGFSIQRQWDAARSTQKIGQVLSTLRAMAGDRERCMYCVDSHGSDIEHFRPKSAFPEQAFTWGNLLLCCTECGRMKGDRFPEQRGQPLLIDPSAQNPWDHLDFDPDTGNLVARYQPQAAEWSPQGLATVDLLQLDRREALSVGRLRCLQRLNDHALRACAAHPVPEPQAFAQAMRELDDHGLMPWCLRNRSLLPQVAGFTQLRKTQPALWQACEAQNP